MTRWIVIVVVRDVIRVEREKEKEEAWRSVILGRWKAAESRIYI